MRKKKKECKLKGCNKPVYGRGYCSRHYNIYRMGLPDMKRCKIRWCNLPHQAKGYCEAHYNRLKRGIQLEFRCRWCGNIIKEFGKWRYCSGRCMWKSHYKRHGKKYHKKYIEKFLKTHVAVPQFVSAKRQKKGVTGEGVKSYVYTDGLTKELKPMIDDIKNKVLLDCAKNPKKFLRGIKVDKECNERCMLFRRNKCETKREDNLCDKIK